MKQKKLFAAGFMCLVVCLSFVALAWAQTPVEEKVGVLVTDWGTPDGMDFNYYSQIGHRSRVGIEATGEDMPCEEDYWGLYPYRSFHGVLPHNLAFETDNWEFIYDAYGVYWVNGDGTYTSILDPGITVSDADFPDGVNADPANSITFGRGRAIYTVDSRDGTDHLSDMVIIGQKVFNDITGKDAYVNFPNGISDMDELDMASWWRTIRMLAIPDYEGGARMTEFTLLMEEELTNYFEDYFGDTVDIRFGMYEAVGDLTRRHEDVAVDMADDGLSKMVLTRETSDNNDYANIAQTRHWVDYELCQNGYDSEDVDITQVKQIGRTPEYNTMVGMILQQHLERLNPGDREVALAYVTYGNPWPGTSANLDSAFAVSFPWVRDVYPENAYYNYLSFKRYAQDTFGSDYNLVWTRPGSSGDVRKDNYYSYAMFQKEFYTIPGEDEAEFNNVRANIERLKEDGKKEAIFLLSHWYYNSIDNGLAQRDVQQLPMNSYEDLANGKFWIDWCESSTPSDEVVWTEVSPEGMQCSNPDDIHIVYTECFDSVKNEMINGYAQRIRGGVERFGVFPNLDISIEAEGAISKLTGGTAEITSGPRAGAKIVVPADPAPDEPERYYPEMCSVPVESSSTVASAPSEASETQKKWVVCKEIEYTTINDPENPKIGAWFDFTVYLGEQREVEPGVVLPDVADNSRVGPRVYFGPYRTLFNKPARITLPYDAELVTNPSALRPRIFNDLTRTWDTVYQVPAGEGLRVDSQNSTVSFDVQILGLFTLCEEKDYVPAIDKCKVKAGKNGKGDSIQFSGLLDVTEADFIAAKGDTVVVTIEADDIPDLNATTFSFPIEEAYLKKGKYKSPKVKPIDKSDPATSLQIDTIKGTMKFSGKNLDLTGLSCPITVKIQIGNYFALILLDEEIVNGPKKPCPPELMMDF